MFKFNFDNFEFDDPQPAAEGRTDLESKLNRTKLGDEELSTPLEPSTQPWTELTIDNLLVSLPPVLSYSPLAIPLSSNLRHSDGNASTNEPFIPSEPTSKDGHIFSLPRRDLFDARYQLIQEDNDTTNTTNAAPQTAGDGKGEIAFFDDPSDLVPGIYEGGLKTWECALSLVECLVNLRDAGQDSVERIQGKRVLEIGCGTAIPSIYLLYRLFEELATPVDDDKVGRSKTEFVLQDYNALVLRLVTFPNIILAWYASPLAKSLRENTHSTTDEDASPFDVNQQGDLNITSELMSAFQQSLEENNISLRLIAGSWAALLDADAEGEPLVEEPFDIILTSETIYQPSSLETLVRLLAQASGKQPDARTRSSTNNVNDEERMENGVQKLALEGTWLEDSDSRLCLVAAKVLYFGVGGGIADFERSVEKSGGRTTTILRHESGVGRKVLRVDW